MKTKIITEVWRIKNRPIQKHGCYGTEILSDVEN